MKHGPMVTVGIPTLGRDSVLLDTLKMVLAQDYHNYEVIVADQTIRPASDFKKKLKSLTKDGSKLKYFLVTPASLPAARNFILDKASGDLIVFIDDDVVIDKSFIRHHVDAHQKQPMVVAVAGRINQKNLPISEEPLFFDAFGLPRGTFNCPVSGPAKDWPGGNHSVKTSVIRKVGGYHTAYQHDAVREESDAAHRLTKNGYKIFFSAEAGLVHLAAPSGGSRIAVKQFDNQWFYINDLLFMLRTVSFINLPVAMFRRWRIYSGGSGSFSSLRFRRSVLFIRGLIVASGLFMFRRKSFKSREVGRVI